jgi:hypothetical protein
MAGRGGKRNKHQKPHSPFKARCQRKVCFNMASEDGGFHTPKSALFVLQKRRDEMQVLLASELFV